MAINASRLGFIVDMGIRGTGTAQFDYADASEQYLLPRPLIIYLKDDDRSTAAVSRARAPPSRIERAGWRSMRGLNTRTAPGRGLHGYGWRRAPYCTRRPGERSTDGSRWRRTERSPT